MDIFWYKLLISICLALGLFLLRYFENDILKKVDIRLFSHFFLSFLLFRILPFVFIYLILDFDTTSDVNIFFSSALSAIHGGIVYRDFVTVYSPLFPYISGILLSVWSSPKAIVLMMLIVESIIMWGTIKLFRHRNVTICSLIYYLLPTTIIFSVLGGQEDIWMWGGVVTAIHLKKKYKNDFWLGIGLAVGLLASKLIFVLILPGFFLLVNKRAQLLIGFALVFIPIVSLIFYYVGWELLSPVNEANIPRTPNLFSLIRPLLNGKLPFGLSIFNWLGLIVNLAIGVIWIILRWKKSSINQPFVELFIITFVLLMLLQQSSYSNYAFIFMMPFVYYFYESLNRFEWYYFLFLNILLVIQPALWWHNGLFYINNTNDLQRPLFFTEYIMEIFIIVGLVGILRKLFKQSSCSINGVL